MDLFEFVVSLYVVLAGLGITLLVRSIGQIIESRSNIELYWVHSCWLVYILLAHVHSWFAMWRYRDEPSWTLGEFLILLSVPTVLYLASHVSVPEISEEKRDRKYVMRDYYFERHRLIIGLIGVSVILNVLCEYVFAQGVIQSMVNLMRVIGLTVLGVGMISANPRVHAVITVIVGALVLYSLGVIGDRIE